MKIRFSSPFKQANRKRIEKERAEESIAEKFEEQAQKINENTYKEPTVNSFAKLIQVKNEQENKPIGSLAKLLLK